MGFSAGLSFTSDASTSISTSTSTSTSSVPWTLESPPRLVSIPLVWSGLFFWNWNCKTRTEGEVLDKPDMPEPDPFQSCPCLLTAPFGSGCLFLSAHDVRHSSIDLMQGKVPFDQGSRRRGGAVLGMGSNGLQTPLRSNAERAGGRRPARGQYLPKLKTYLALVSEVYLVFSLLLLVCFYVLICSRHSHSNKPSLFYNPNIRCHCLVWTRSFVRFVSCGDDVSGSAGERLGDLVRSQMQTANSWTWPVPALAGEEGYDDFLPIFVPSRSIFQKGNQSGRSVVLFFRLLYPRFFDALDSESIYLPSLASLPRSKTTPQIPDSED
ncbi:hypothetical protein DL98DRAFT_197113 [Cadophora sp. DSE1049]|nr:hypothetical protein DL98DRAFT_197113 [Cadophora sp. DSE1049]